MKQLDEIRYRKTDEGQLLYDLVFVDLTTKWLAQKHHVPIATIREMRRNPTVQKLRRSVRTERAGEKHAKIG